MLGWQLRGTHAVYTQGKVDVDCANINHMSCCHWRLQALELLPKRAAPEGGFSGLPGLKVLKVGSRWVCLSMDGGRKGPCPLAAVVTYLS